MKTQKLNTSIMHTFLCILRVAIDQYGSNKRDDETVDFQFSYWIRLQFEMSTTTVTKSSQLSWLERGSNKPKVVGSTPTEDTTFCRIPFCFEYYLLSPQFKIQHELQCRTKYVVPLSESILLGKFHFRFSLRLNHFF